MKQNVRCKAAGSGCYDIIIGLLRNRKNTYYAGQD